MNGGLALHVALALHGNPWLAGGTGPAPALEHLSTFQYVRSFDADGATTTAAWFEQLRAEGVTHLALACRPLRTVDDIARTAFAGVDPWALFSVDHGAWTATMQHVAGERERPWAVRVQRWAGGRPPALPDVGGAAQYLRAALAEASAVAEQEGWRQWTEWFGQAAAQLDSAVPEPRFHPDLAPPDLDLERRRLLAGAVDAWVFGGMGSWNDTPPGEATPRAAYDEATVRLYTACTLALSVVVDG